MGRKITPRGRHWLFALVVAATASAIVVAPALAATFPEKPGRKDYFRDEANLIAPAERQAINQIAGQLLAEQKVPLFVVTITSFAAHEAADYTIERYATELFDTWGIGSPTRNYGMLLLVSLGDRKARIELGAAWERSHDAQAQEVTNKLVTPAFKRGSYSQGIADGVRGMDSLARGLALPKPTQPWWALPALIGGFILIVWVIVSLFRSGRRGWGWALIAALGALIFFALRAAAAGSGGGFGGGSSGGGGASGSW